MKRLLIFFLVVNIGATNGFANIKKANMLNLSGLIKRQDPIEKFWAWFKTNELRLRKFEEDPGKYLNEILVRQRKYKPHWQ